MDVPWKVIVAFLGVFVAGAIFGGVFTVGVNARRGGNGGRVEKALTQMPPANPGPRPQFAGPPGPNPLRNNPITVQLMNQFSRKLNPTADQRDEFRKILGRAGEDMHRLRQQNVEDVGRVTERMYADVSAVLTLEQRGELEKMRKQLEERIRNDARKRAEAAAAEKAGKSGPIALPPAPAAPLTP